MIWLVRHGESTANAGEISWDYTAIDLTMKGRLQSLAVAKACSERPDWVGLSPYRRARQTAEPLLDRHSVPTKELAVQEFTYLTPTRCAGMNSEGRLPYVHEYWNRWEPFYRDGEAAETFAEFCDRVNQFVKWSQQQTGFGVVFSHEQFIRAVIVANLYQEFEPTVTNMKRFFALRTGLPIPNGSITKLKRDATNWLISGVDVSHLKT